MDLPTSPGFVDASDPVFAAIGDAQIFGAALPKVDVRAAFNDGAAAHFDGDADRLGVVTNTCEINWPDRQLMLFAIDVLSRNPDVEIIYDVKCTEQEIRHMK